MWQAKKKGADYIQEDQNAPEDVLDNTWEVFGRVLGLASGDGNGLCSAICFSNVNIVFGISPEENSHAKAAVTNTDANPPIPSWKGAPEILQFSPPI